MTGTTEESTELKSTSSMFVVVGVAVGCMILWGGTPAATRYAVNGLEPIMAAAMRTIVAAVISVLIVTTTRLPTPTGFHGWGLAAISGVCCFAIFPSLLGSGIARTSTGHASLIIAMGPIATGLIAAVLARKIPGKFWWIGTMTAFGGVAVLISEGIGGGVETGDAIGDLICLIAMCVVSIGYIAGGRLSAEQNAFGVTCWGLIIAGGVMLPVVVWNFGTLEWMVVDKSVWGGIIYLALISSIIGYAGFFWALDKGGVMRISPIQFVVPVAGVLFGCILFDETFTLVMSFCALTIIGGIAFARRA